MQGMKPSRALFWHCVWHCAPQQKHGCLYQACVLQVQDVLALGAIFATTDSVAVLQVLDKDRSPILFSLVFGEGVINDAAGVALLRAIQVCFSCMIL